MRFSRFYFVALLTSLFWGTSSASAGGLAVTIDDLTQSGNTGSFQVILQNTESAGGTVFDVASFTFELEVDSASGLQFTAADYPVSGVVPPYIFDGTGFGAIFSIPLSSTTFPSYNVVGSDAEFVSLPGIPVNPGDVFALGVISFEATTNVALDTLLTSFVRSGTSFSDGTGREIPYSLPNVAVPEPHSLVLCAAGGLFIGVFGVSRRTRRGTPEC